MIKFVLIAALCFGAASARHIQYTDCAHNEIVYVDVVPCDKEPCQFQVGSTAKVTGSFNANEDTKAATVSATVVVDGTNVDLPGLDPDLCKKVTCPLVKGQNYVFEYDVDVQSYFPDMQTTMTWSAVGDDGKSPLFCASAPIGLYGEDEDFDSEEE